MRAEEILGKNVADLKADGTFDAILNPEIVRTGRSSTSVQVNRNGRKLVLSGYPVFDADGTVVLVVTFVRDITVMASLKEQVAAQQQLIARYSEHIQSISRHGASDGPSLVAESPGMKNLLSLLGRVAPTDATVLLQGETGVGKDILARKIHDSSLRREKPFFKLDCTTIPENLIESELFGYCPGAFSGAHPRGKIGFFEMADTGTLFLDEIGELPSSMQAKLLRILQDHEVVRVGSTEPRKVDVRIIAATNRNLEKDVRQGAFRSDLFYRLRVADIHIPPLRERPEDILPLAEHFLSVFCSKYKKWIRFSDETRQALIRHRWPGNVRELENTVQSLVITADKDVVEAGDLPGSFSGPSTGSWTKHPFPIDECDGKSLKAIMADIERDLLVNALKRFGTLGRVAEHFKVDRSTVFRKIKRYR